MFASRESFLPLGQVLRGALQLLLQLTLTLGVRLLLGLGLHFHRRLQGLILLTVSFFQGLMSCIGRNQSLLQ